MNKKSSANKLLTNATMNVRAARWTRGHETKDQHKEKDRPNDATWIGDRDERKTGRGEGGGVDPPNK